jgi:predicted permease
MASGRGGIELLYRTSIQWLSTISGPPRFGAAAGILGHDLTINGQLHRVVGVLDRGIELGTLSEIDVWIPEPDDPRLGSRASRRWQAVGRLSEDAAHAQVHAQVAAIAGRLEREYPDTNRNWSARVGTTRDALAGADTWLVLSLLSLVVALFLLLACANVMNLLIARLIGRRQELAVRTALGGTRGQVVRQVLAESVVLGVVGGALGLAVAWAGLQGIHAVTTEPFFRQLDFDFRVLAFAVVLSVVAPLAFSVLPTRRILREDVRTTLSEGSTRSVGSATAARGRSSLVVLQVSLAVTLLIVAALVVQSVQHIVSSDLGYDPGRLLVAQIDVAPWKVADEGAALRVRQEVLARVKAIPGAEGAAPATHLPALQFAPEVAFDIAARVTEEGDRPRAALTVVTADYFAVLGIPMLAGRGFQAADAASLRAVAVVSAEAARRFWLGTADAVGATIGIGVADGPSMEATVIGVARNTVNPDLSQGPLPALFVLDEHRPARSTFVVVRGAAPAALAPAHRAAVTAVDPDLPTYQLRTLTEAFADEHSSNRLLSGMFAAFALIAVLLSMAGLYGVLSYAVSQRSGEIAMRLALGAPARLIATEFIGQSVRLAAAGTAFGTAAAYGIANAIRSVLFGVTAGDPTTYAAAVALIVAAALAASWVPMRRAVSIDPIESLRRT